MPLSQAELLERLRINAERQKTVNLRAAEISATLGTAEPDLGPTKTATLQGRPSPIADQ